MAEDPPEQQQPTYNVLKTWAFDDWGLYGRGDELLARALARHPRVGRVVHVQPPIDPAELRKVRDYERRNANLLLRLLPQLVDAHGLVLIADPQRAAAARFLERVES